jgi:ParB/RepB/Spo0J family partition protein
MPAGKSRAAEIAIVRPAQPRTGYQAVAGATERRLPGALEVPLEQVAADLTQPRRDWQHGEGERRLEELTGSIREFGVLQPLVVREEGTLEDGRQRYVIIAGGRRYMAAQRAGLAAVPVVVRGAEPQRARVLQLIENLQRQDLSPLDEARAYQELMDLEGLSPPALAARLHISAQHVRDRLRVLADQVLADAVARGQISATAARDIMQLPDEEVEAFRKRVRGGERLQTNDVASARARLIAAGIINPRRKAPRPLVSSVGPKLATDPPLQTSAHEASPMSLISTSAVSDAEPLWQGSLPRGMPMSETAPNALPQLVQTVDVGPEPQDLARSLLRDLQEGRRRDVLRILEVGAEAGWTCSYLLALAREVDAKQR